MENKTYRLHEMTENLLARGYGTVALDHHRLLLDTVLRWTMQGCPATFHGQSNGLIRFWITTTFVEHEDGEVERIPVLTRQMHRYLGYPSGTWDTVHTYGDPNIGLVKCLNELDELLADAIAGDA